MRPTLLTNYIRILECCVLESEKVNSRINIVSGYGISPGHLDKKEDYLEIYSKVFAKRHPKKDCKKWQWDEILSYLEKYKKNNKFLLKLDPEFSAVSLEKWFVQESKKFKQRPQLTSDFFRKHKGQLLKERLIVKLPSSDKRSKNYSITPLGICFLVKNRRIGLRGEFLKKTFKIINSFYVQPIPKIFGTKNKFDFQDTINKLLMKNIDSSLIDVINKFLYHQIEYSKSSFDDSYYVFIRYQISFNLENIIARFVLRKDEIKYFENIVVKENPTPDKRLNEKQFHAYFATFLLYGIFYQVIKFHFDAFISLRKINGVYDFKFSDYDYKLEKIKKYDKKLLELVIMLNGYFSKLLSDDSEIKTQLEFFQNKVQQYKTGVESKNKRYKHDTKSPSYGEVVEG